MDKCANPECDSEELFELPRLYCCTRCKRRHYYLEHGEIEKSDAIRWNTNNSERKNEINANYRRRKEVKEREG